MSKFEIGEKVACYMYPKRRVGKVSSIHSDSIYGFVENDNLYFVHEKQLRKIKKKIAKKFEIGDYVRHKNLDFVIAKIFHVKPDHNNSFIYRLQRGDGLIEWLHQNVLVKLNIREIEE